MRIEEAAEIEALITGGMHDPAAARLDAALSRRPPDATALLLRADLELARERNDSARKFVELALQAAIDGPPTAIRLLNALARLSESGLMIRISEQIPPPQWRSATALTQVAHILMGVGAFDAALPFAAAAAERDPRHPPGLYCLATLKTFFGDHEAAADLCRRCLELIPHDPSPFWLLSRLRQPGGADRVDRLRPLLAAATSAQDRAWLAYALHNELHELGDHHGSWEALSTACEAMRSRTGSLLAKQSEVFDALLAVRDWAPPSRPQPPQDLPGPHPIFVMGLHRSGTTLAEQILAGHPDVASGGETYDLRAQLRRASRLHYGHELDPRVIARRNDLDHRAVGANYVRGMAWRARGKRFVTEKLPSNYFNAGFIARALPASRIILLDRDPVDVGFSSLRTLFSHAAPYSYSQADFIEHHRRYRALVAHWKECLPDRILEVRYDDLVAAPEATARRMAAFVGLEFVPAMLALDQRTGAVATASSVMMRDGIRRDRGKVWKPYERQLAPLLEAFSGRA